MAGTQEKEEGGGALLNLDDLASRHPGLTTAIGQCYAEAAAVCLSRHHDSPTPIELIDDKMSAACLAEWNAPDDQTLRAWHNEIDATEFGAYGVALAAVELNRGLVAVGRAETLSGADYYVAPIGSPSADLENCLRLEVSGTDAGDLKAIEARLKAKLAQASKGKSNLPALASVVGFKTRAVAIGTLVVEQQ